MFGKVISQLKTNKISIQLLSVFCSTSKWHWHWIFMVLVSFNCNNSTTHACLLLFWTNQSVKSITFGGVSRLSDAINWQSVIDLWLLQVFGVNPSDMIVPFAMCERHMGLPRSACLWVIWSWLLKYLSTS